MSQCLVQMPKLDPKKVKDIPIGTAEGNIDIAISCGSTWSGHDFDQGRGDSYGLFSSFYRCLAKREAKSSTPFPKMQQHFPQLTLLPDILSALSNKPEPLFALTP